jgi:hypothetical protein
VIGYFAKIASARLLTICRGWVKVKNGDVAEGISLPTAKVFRTLCLDNDPTYHQRKRFHENRTKQPTAWP